MRRYWLLGLLDIHEDAVKRLVHLHHLNSLLSIRRIDDGMTDRSETLS